MITRNFTDLVQELALEAGEDTSDAQVMGQFEAWLEEGYVTATSNARFLWQNGVTILTIMQGKPEYTLDADVAEITLITEPEGNQKIGYNTAEDLAQLGIDFEASGEPQYWFYSGVDSDTSGKKITFVPNPIRTKNLTIRTLLSPYDIRNTKVIPAPIEIIMLVKQYVRAMYQYNDDRTELYNQSITKFYEQLAAYNARYVQPRRSASRLKVKTLPRNAQAGAASED